MIQEFADHGTLLGLRKRLKETNQKMSEPYLRQIIVQLFSALAFTHARRVIHRDIKAENILLMGNGDLKIGDWGIAA